MRTGSNPSQFDLLEELATSQGDAIARRLHALITRHREAQSKRDLLANYHDEYRDRLESSIRTGITGESLHNFQIFLRNLKVALTQQDLDLAQSMQEIERVKVEWLSAKVRAESFATLSDRQLRQQQRIDVRDEQKQQDETSARIVRGRPPNTN